MIEIIVAALSILATLITLFFGKRNEQKAKAREVKEAKYVRFLEAFISTRSGQANEDQLNTTLQLINLVGSARVVKATQAFVDCFPSNSSQHNLKKNKQESEPPDEAASKLQRAITQNECYAKMIAAMRVDLYGENAAENFPDSIKLILFS